MRKADSLMAFAWGVCIRVCGGVMQIRNVHFMVTTTILCHERGRARCLLVAVVLGWQES